MQSNAAVELKRESPYLRRQPQLLIEWEPWWPSFLRNLRDAVSAVLHGNPPVYPDSNPGQFWPDVFVYRPFPWKNFGESAFLHALAVLCIIGGTKLWLSKQHVTVSEALNQTKLIYYDVSEYLPPIPRSSPPPKAAHAQKGAPAFAKQEIISVPKSPDNSTQTILNPPHPNILPSTSKIELPNLVAWNVNPQPPVAALSNPKLVMPAIALTPVQPPPDVRRTSQLGQAKMALPEVAAVQPAPDPRRDSPKTLKLPEVSAVEPPASPDVLKRRVDELEMARLQLASTVGAPKPPLPEVRSSVPPAEKPAAQAVPLPSTMPPPAPSTRRDGAGPQAMGQIVALSLQPKAPDKEIKIPDASRNGIFAAVPTGQVGGPGLPEIVAAKEDANPAKGNAGQGSGVGNSPAKEPNFPAGISIGGGRQSPQSQARAVVAGSPPTSPDRPGTRMIAAVSLPDVFRRPVPPYSASPEAKVEDRVFAGRKIYSMQLNMPNLTSAGGSWIMRFAELSENPLPGDVSTPVAIDKVDPAYPAQLIRDQVEGTVILYAVIHSDGTVGEVRVLEGFQDQLNENARLALLRWHFRPAMKNGVPVDLEAVVQIPFRARKIGFKY